MSKRLSPLVVFVMAAATGLIVANLYYLQPLLHGVRTDFGISTIQTSALVTLVQVGYALGLAFVVPLGDLLPRRRLIVTIYLSAALVMLLGSVIHRYVFFAVLTALIGLTSVAGQVMIPFAADLAPVETRGRTVARLMSGLLLGILLSRTFAGILSESIGWRGVYRIAAGALMVAGLALGRLLPSEGPRTHVAYRRLVAGSFQLLGTFSQLRRRAWLGATVFAAFSAMWSTLAFHLSSAPFHYSNITIGLFGLLGVGGVMAANWAGKHADNGRHHYATKLAAISVALSFGLLWIGADSVWFIALGIFALDVGVQGMQITNQAIIYALAPDKRSRINSAYMVCYFTGGAAGSLVAGLVFAHGGWTGVNELGLVLSALIVVPAFTWRAPAPTLA